MSRWAPVALAVARCGGDPGLPDAAAMDASPPAYAPGEPIVVSAGVPGNSEDPAVLRARDGSIYVAWYSQASGDDVLITRTTDGVHWAPPVHVTTGAAKDLGPTLYQDAHGVIHAVWFRWMGAPPGHLVHNRASAPDDGLRWDPATEVDVTTASGTDDWVPSLTADATGALVVAFARNTCPPPDTCYGIWTTTSPDGTAWRAAQPVVTAGGGVEHHLPAIAGVGGALALVWDPYDATAGVPWEGLQTGAHIALRTSTPAGWTEPRDVTLRDAAAVSAFPTLYADHADQWHVAWLAASATGQAVVERPLAALTGTPDPLPIDGYSPRIVATPTPGVFLAAWVAGAPPDHQIVVRVFGKP